MRKIFLMLAVTAMIAACNDEKKPETGSSDTMPAKTTVPLPYPMIYSSSFEMGNPEYSAMILNGSWKDWENNTLDNMKNWVADTIVAFQSDNTMVMGRDSLMADWKRGRAKYTSVVDSIEAVMPVYSTDKKENWVLVWARDYSTKADGTRDMIEIMETWRINKDGKADMLLQYDRHARKK